MPYVAGLKRKVKDALRETEGLYVSPLRQQRGFSKPRRLDVDADDEVENYDDDDDAGNENEDGDEVDWTAGEGSPSCKMTRRMVGERDDARTHRNVGFGDHANHEDDDDETMWDLVHEDEKDFDE